VEVNLTITEQTVDELVDLVLARIREAPERRFLSKAALAKYLGVSERRVKTLRSRGLPARKIGRDLYFDVNEVSRFIDSEGEPESVAYRRRLTRLELGNDDGYTQSTSEHAPRTTKARTDGS
jgi:ribosome-binding protein aMBF1 (putative translation factor)